MKREKDTGFKMQTNLVIPHQSGECFYDDYTGLPVFMLSQKLQKLLLILKPGKQDDGKERLTLQDKGPQITLPHIDGNTSRVETHQATHISGNANKCYFHYFFHRHDRNDNNQTLNTDPPENKIDSKTDTATEKPKMAKKKATGDFKMAAHHHPATEGGWGWFVVLGAHMCIFFGVGWLQTISIYLVPLQQEFGSSSATLGWIVSSGLATTFLSGAYYFSKFLIQTV